MSDLGTVPHLDGVEHRFVTTPGGHRIHVALAGPEDGPPLMLVHGFPQHWWEWRHQIGPLAADGVRVIVPDLRGAGWSDAPAGAYLKSDMSEDLAAVLVDLGVGPVKIAAHDWGGPVAFSLARNHPEMVTAFTGFNTFAPVLGFHPRTLLHAWALWYQIPIMVPVLGPRVLRTSRRRFFRFVIRWAGGGFGWSRADEDIFLDRLRDRSRAEAGSQWYRTFQRRELWRWMHQRASEPVDIPLRWVTGTQDPVITSAVHISHRALSADNEFEDVPGIGHWIVEQAPDLVLDRLRALMGR